MGDEGRVFIAYECCFAKANVVWHGAAWWVVRDEDLAPTVEGDDLVVRVECPAAPAVAGSNVGAESADGAVDRDVRERVNPRGDLLFVRYAGEKWGRERRMVSSRLMTAFQTTTV